MNLNKALNKQAVCLELKGGTKEAVITELIHVMGQAGLVKDPNAALAAVQEREQQMSTGMQNGVAIPHGRTDTTDCLVAAVGVHPDGIDFDAIDDEPSTIFVMTLSPASRSGPQLKFLAEISRLLTDAAVRDKIRNATSPEEIIGLLMA